MKRVVIFFYGTVSYLTCLAIFAYLAGFIGNFGVPKSMDSPAEGPWQTALLIDLGLLLIFTPNSSSTICVSSATSSESMSRDASVASIVIWSGSAPKLASASLTHVSTCSRILLSTSASLLISVLLQSLFATSNVVGFVR